MHSLRGEGNGAILTSSCLHVLLRSQLTTAGRTAAGYEPQLRVRPGPEMGSTTLTMSSFPAPLPVLAADLAEFGALGTSHPSL